jgi:hypothetical protein
MSGEEVGTINNSRNQMKKEQHKKLSLCQGHREQFAGYRRRYGRR